MKIRTLIVDDEPLAREGLALLLARDPEIEIVGESADGAAALLAIRHQHPDIVFLDVQMPKHDGFEVLGALAPAERPIVVFATAYDQYAIRAFEACAVDYLLKPFSDDRFAQALARAKGEWKQRRTADVGSQVEALLAHVRVLTGSAPFGPGGPATRATGAAAPARAEYAERIIVKSGGDLHFVKTSDVLWLEAQGDFVKVQTVGQPQLVRETLQSMERKLDGGRFVRIHRSFLVNIEHIRRVAPALYGDHTVVMSDGSKLRLSRSYRGKLKALTGQPPG
jgi:two-component system, LytTR family, response regulator